MPTPFENFVNTELPKRIGTNESPTTPQAGDLPVFTGVGLLTESKTPAELGLAVLVDGVVLANQLPSYVDDVLEFADLASFPVTGESGKVYVALDTNKTYRWSGSTYVQIGSDLALGETAATAYRGDKGKVAYDHSQVTGNPHGATTADITDSTDKRYVTDAQRTRVNTAASGTADGYLTSADWTTFNGKQAALTSGTNIKTVNGSSLLGSGDLVVSDANSVKRGTGNTVAATSEVVNCTSVTVVGANCVVSNSTNLNVTGDNLNIEGLLYNTTKTLTFPHGSHIVGRKSTQGLYVTVSSAFQLTKPDNSSVVLADSNGTKPYIGFYYYGVYQDVAYHRVTVMGTAGDNNYSVFAVSTRRDTSVTVTTIQAGAGYITLAAADTGAGRLTLTVSTTYSIQDTITAYVESHYGNFV